MDTAIVVAILAAVATVAAAVISAVAAFDSRSRLLKSIEAYSEWNSVTRGSAMSIDEECLKKLRLDTDWQIEKLSDPRWSTLSQMVAICAAMFIVFGGIWFILEPPGISDSAVHLFSFMSVFFVLYLIVLMLFVRQTARRKFFRKAREME